MMSALILSPFLIKKKGQIKMRDEIAGLTPPPFGHPLKRGRPAMTPRAEVLSYGGFSGSLRSSR